MSAYTTVLPEKTPLKVYVHLYRGVNAEAYRRRFAEGIEPEETPYGFHRAADQGCTVAFSSDSPRFFSKALSYISRKWLKFDLPHAYYNRSKIREADIVWTITEGEALAISLLKMLNVVPKRPIIGNIIMLLHEWDRMAYWKRTLFRRLLGSIETITVHSNSCLLTFQRYFPEIKCSLMYFGINIDKFNLTLPRLLERQDDVITIFAPGNDLTRDWITLLAAFGNDERFRVVFICAWLTDEELSGVSNATVIRKPRLRDFLSCYHEADFVAVPMKDNIYSGITVALEAAALGKPVLTSRTGGLPTYFDEGEVWYTPVGDAVAMRELVLSASLHDRERRAVAAQERFLENDYSTQGLVHRYLSLTHQMLIHE